MEPAASTALPPDRRRLKSVYVKLNRTLEVTGLVLVNGRPAAAARKVREGDSIELQDEQAPQSTQALPGADAPRLVARTAAFAFLYKPAAMHTESLAGKPGESLQDVVESLAGGKARLLNRLDFATSGLAAAALNRAGEEAYHSAQDRGLTEKRYLALLEGALTRPVLADRRLLLKNRSRVLVELDRHPDVRRHTRITPLAAPVRRALNAGIRIPKKRPPTNRTARQCPLWPTQAGNREGHPLLRLATPRGQPDLTLSDKIWYCIRQHKAAFSCPPPRMA